MIIGINILILLDNFAFMYQIFKIMQRVKLNPVKEKGNSQVKGNAVLFFLDEFYNMHLEIVHCKAYKN